LKKALLNAIIKVNLGKDCCTILQRLRQPIAVRSGRAIDKKCRAKLIAGRINEKGKSGG